MKNISLLSCLLASTLLAAPAITLTANATSSVSSGLHTPPRGSAERSAILDAMRAKHPDLGDIVYVVSYLKVNNGWAWLEAAGQSRDGRNHYEPEQALLHRVGGHWKVLEMRPGGEDCLSDPTCANDQKYFRKLKARHPSVPTNIFPH